ncbi:hypothetical protein GcM1_212010, partial [Golovinomyces cichoracearum]
MDENIATATATTILSAEDAAALATGIASNAFEVPENEGVEPLSLPAEGNYPTFEAAKDAANHHAMLAGANTLTGIPASRTLTALKTADSTGVWTTKDIHNAAAWFKSESLQGKRPNEALIAKLELAKAVGELFFSYTLSNEGRIEKLSIRYLNENPDILILDCTYKTNRFGMPLLDILGVDGLDQGFTIGVAFMNGESEHDYAWVVKILRSQLDE